MNRDDSNATARATALTKIPTGIDGFDDITLGGLPAGRPTLLCGSAGCGKTLFAMTFLVHGARQYDEPGVFMSFEERADELATNVASLGYDVDALVAARRLAIDVVHIERSEIEESGEYDLEGLFVRLGYAVDSIGAKRVVLDTLEALFAGLSDSAILRSELRRLFAWLKDKGVTAIITAERGEGQLTRYGIEEYVSDCVVLLDNRVVDQVTTRRLRIVKYRGSAHGTNEFPFLIDEQGISVLPITSAVLDHRVSDEVVSSGIAGVDAMLGRGGYYRGSSVLVSGLAGTGKSTFSASFIDAACRRGERSLFVALEESPAQIIRNMRSVGIDLQRHVDAGILRFDSARPSLYGFEMHLTRIGRDIERFAPSTVVVDPISAFRGPASEVHATLLRLADLCKSRGITAMFITLSVAGIPMNETERGISSLMDTWISLDDAEDNGERNRLLFLLKARGMKHSNQVREFRMTDHGIELVDAFIGPSGVLTGSARLAQEARDKLEALARGRDRERVRREFEHRRKAVELQIAELRARLEADEFGLSETEREDRTRREERGVEREEQVRHRSGAGR